MKFHRIILILLTTSCSETTSNGSVDLSKSAPAKLPDFVAAAKKNVWPTMYLPANAQKQLLTIAQNVKALVSIGGWTGSRHFSTSVGSATNRTAFVKTVTDMVKQYDLDGVDFE